MTYLLKMLQSAVEAMKVNENAKYLNHNKCSVKSAKQIQTANLHALAAWQRERRASQPLLLAGTLVKVGISCRSVFQRHDLHIHRLSRLDLLEENCLKTGVTMLHNHTDANAPA